MRDLFSNQKITKFLVPFLMATALAVLAGCSSGTTGTTTAPAAPSSAASIQLSGVPTTIKSDNSTTSTITVYALNANNAAVANAPVILSADTGLLSSSLVTTDASGKATVTFSSGTANKSNRTATITATSGGGTAMLPVQIIGSTLSLLTTTSTVPANGSSPATLTVTAKDAGGAVIQGATVTLTQAGSGTVTITPATGTTNANGQLAVSVAGATSGTATVTVTAAGTMASTNFTVGAGATTFGISLLTLSGGTGVVPTSPKSTAMHIGDSLAVQVSAPGGTANVTFATTIGTWGNASNVQTVAVAGGVATATLTTAAAGVASVQVYDAATPTINDTLTVGMTALTPAKISLQASPTVIPRTVGSTVGFSNLTAMVYDNSGAPVGNAPVAFSIVSGTGTNSGETISPVVAFTATTTTGGLALGAAPATFTAGSLSSGGQGVQVRASVVGTAIATQPLYLPNGLPAPNATTSSYDAAIHIGGTAGSLAIGQAAKITDPGLGGMTTYSFAMSVLVADSNGNPAPLGTVVNISAWPIAFTTGSKGPCSPDPDGFVWSAAANGGLGGYVAGNGGTFYNEDANQNLFPDPGEDGTRKFYASGVTIGGGTTDGQITPQNSWGGTVVSTKSSDLPGTATTDANGLATFNLTYTKSSAIWIITRISAQAVVQGAPTAAMLDMRLPASTADANPICYLPPSPFTF